MYLPIPNEEREYGGAAVYMSARGEETEISGAEPAL